MNSSCREARLPERSGYSIMGALRCAAAGAAVFAALVFAAPQAALAQTLLPPDNTLPSLVSAKVTGTRLALTYNELLDRNSVPAADAFTVTVAGTAASLSAVEVVGARVVLTLATAVTSDQMVTLDYTPPTSNPIQDVAGNPATLISGRAVATPPILLSATVTGTTSGTTLTMTYSEPLNENSVPSVLSRSLFAIVDTTVWYPTAVDIAGPAVTLTLCESSQTSNVPCTPVFPVNANPTVSVGYSVPTSNPIQDPNGNLASAIPITSPHPVTVVDMTAPVLVPVNTPLGISPATVDGTRLTLTYSEPLDEGSVPAAAAFTVTAGGTPNTVSAVDVTGATVVLTLATEVTSGQAVTVAYTVPSSNPIQDMAGNEAADIASQTVATPPSLVSASVSGMTLTMTYNEPLDTNSVPDAASQSLFAIVDGSLLYPTGVAITGSTVALTLPFPVASASQTVSVGYSVPGLNPIQDQDGNRAPAIPVTSPHPVTVVDTTPPALRPPPTGSMLEIYPATVDGTRLTLAYTEPLDENSVPAATAYSVTVAGTAAAPSSVDVVGATVVLTLAAAVTSGQTVTVNYTMPTGSGANPIQDAAGNPAADFSDQNVWMQSSDATLRALSVTDADDNALTMAPATFSSSTYAYTVTVDDAMTSLKVKATPTHASGSVFGTLARGGGSPSPLTFTSDVAELTGLLPDVYVVTVIGLAEDFATRQEYTVTVTVSGAPSTMILNEADTLTVAAGADLVLNGVGVDHDGGDVTFEWMATLNGVDVTSDVIGGATNGRTETVQTSDVTFNAAAGGVYMVTLTATDDEGETTTSDPVAVTVLSTALSGLAVVDGGGDVQPLTPAFSAGTAAYTVRNPIARIRVTPTAGDPAATLTGSLAKAGGSVETVALASGTATTITRLARGDNVLTITVATSDGATREYTLTVTRTAAEDPTASIAPVDAQEVAEGVALTLTATGSDPDGGTVTYAWTAADAADTDVTADVFPGAKDRDTAVFTAANLGVYTVTLTVTDDEGQTATASLAVTVEEMEEPPPVVVEPPPAPPPPPALGPWLARFGRTAAEQALDSVAERLRASRAAGFRGTVGGQSLAFVPGSGQAAGLGSGQEAGPGYEAGAGFDADAGRVRTMTAGELLLGSSFSMTGAPDWLGGSFAFWGRGAQTRFEGQEDAIDVDGTATSGMLGADYARDRWTVGLALMQSAGEGGYAGRGADAASVKGDIESTLTSVVPWATWQASKRMSLWGAAGYGAGETTLNPDDGAAMEADLDWTMVAAGMRNELPALAGRISGVTLALTSDAMWAGINSDRAGALAATESGVSRLRAGLEGSWTRELRGGRLTPRLAVGGRHDGGDADTGAGMDVGGGVAWSDPGTGISLDVEGRALVIHTADGVGDWGYAAAFSFDPAPATRRGPSFALRQDRGGRSAGGVDALFEAEPLSGRGGFFGPAEPRWTAQAAWGFPAFGGRFASGPEARFGLSPTARDYSLGWRMTPEGSAAPGLSVGLETTRRESAGVEPEHRVGLEMRARW